MTVIEPSWSDLHQLVANTQAELFVCAPYISTEGIGKVFDSLPGPLTVQLRTRLSPTDWANRVSDPEALGAFLEVLDGGGYVTELVILQRVHAKLYVADGRIGLLGSANLSSGGFGGNIELVVRLDGLEAERARELIRRHDRQGRPMSTGQLLAWVNGSRPKVIEARRQAQDDAELLAESQRDLDAVLGFGQGGSRALPSVDRDALEKFGHWLGNNLALPGAQMVSNRLTNADDQHLTGHVKQCFATVARFFAERPDLVDRAAGELNGLKPDDMYSFTDQLLLDAWISHVDAHALDASDFFSYSVLRGILPPSLGGSRANGGGGSSTLKRVFPLVARYLRS